MDAPPAADASAEKSKKPATKKPAGKKQPDKPKPAANKAPPPIPQTVPVTGVLRLPPGPPPAAPQPAGQ